MEEFMSSQTAAQENLQGSHGAMTFRNEDHLKTTT
jgi:hypothetical protein